MITSPHLCEASEDGRIENGVGEGLTPAARAYVTGPLEERFLTATIFVTVSIVFFVIVTTFSTWYRVAEVDVERYYSSRPLTGVMTS
jgi:hypothetical protein